MDKLWFKRKSYGWGWVPITWQGWLATAAYIAGLLFFGFSIDEGSTRREVLLSFFLPVAILTAAFLRLAYKTGEKPRWQWGEDKK